jgi:hypothetical protein
MSLTKDQLEAKVDTLTGERDDYKSKLEAAETQRDDYKSKLEALTNSQSATEAAPASEEDTIRGILKRNGLKKCWMLPTGPCFSEVHAREYAGAEFDSLTVISVEENAEHAI